MTTSAPSSPRRSATARPRRFADPVTRATLLSSDSLLCWVAGVMAENNTIPTPEEASPPKAARHVIPFPRHQTDRIGGGWRRNETRSAGDCRAPGRRLADLRREAIFEVGDGGIKRKTLFYA